MKSVKMFGKSVPLVIVLVGLLVVGASAALLTQYAQITMNVPVEQSVIIYGGDETGTVTDTFNAIGGRTYCRSHTLDNRGHVEAPIDFVWTSSLNDDGITVNYYKDLGYSFAGTSVTYSPYKPDGIDVDIAIEVTGTQVIWTFDFPIDTDLGSGNMGYALVISKDGLVPAYQVHNNDGTDHFYLDGTHLYSKWDDTVDGNYNGWLTGWHGEPVRIANNIPVPDWMECTGDRYHDTNTDGVFTVAIDKCYLGDEFYWAAHFGAGGFYDYGGLSKYPDAWDPWMGIATTFEPVIIAEDIDPYTLAMLEILEFYIVYDFDIALPPDTYSITSTVNVA